MAVTNNKKTNYLAKIFKKNNLRMKIIKRQKQLLTKLKQNNTKTSY